jgi:DeoR family suf operon transcriptional repressor
MVKVGAQAADTPGRVLEHLTKRGPSSVAELSEQLGLTGVTIRHHLGEMRRQGLVASPAPRRRRGRGRPVLVYSVTHFARGRMPENYLEFAVHVLLAAREQLSPAELEGLLVAAGERLGRLPAGLGALSPKTRRRQALRFLDDRGYYPSYTAIAGSGRLLLAHCPYLTAAESCPAVCSFDWALVRSLFGGDGTLTAKIIDGDPGCVFEFRNMEQFDRLAEA